MDMNGMSIPAGTRKNGMSIHAGAGKDGALPCVAQNVRILLVDSDTTSLVSLASQFEQQLYKVTTTESAKVALALFQERNNYYDIVVADISMQEMGISEFIEKLHNQHTTVPIILIAEEYLTMDIAREAMDRNVCYVMSKPPSQRDISNIWIHIRRVTGEMPPVLSNMTNYIEIERDDGSRVGAAGNQKRNNLNMKLDKTDRESVKRKQKQIAETPGSSNHAQLEEDGHKAKKPHLNWTPYLDDKFLQAINILGEHRARPKKILSLMDEPDLTPRHIASHLQKYRRQRKRSLNLQQIDSPFMPAVLPEATVNSFAQGQTFGTASSPYAAAPNLVHYSFYGMKQDQYFFNYSGNNSVKAIINDGIQVPMGNSDGIQVPKGNSEGSYSVNEIINDGVQVPEGNGEGSYSVNAIINNGIQVPNGNGGGNNSFQSPIQDPEGASGRLNNGLKAPNQEPTSKFGPGLSGLANAGDTGNMENDHLGEGSSDSNQEFGGMPSIDEMNQFMQELETSKIDIWDWFK